ncbi:hypothetical protein [Nonomuraea sp. NPDC049158]|uniref:hypothetical protein n=1 Tax=Nonomuraea sp. NPDC049158 TaxID=3155649 RepID=UPI0033DEF69C
MSRFEVATLVLAPPPVVFDASLSVELHASSMRDSREQAVAGVTSGQLSLGDQVTWRARHFGFTWHLTSTISDPFSSSDGLCDAVVLKDGDGLAEVASLGWAAA